MIRRHCGAAVMVLIRAVHDRACPWPAQVSAARELLRRGYGRPRGLGGGGCSPCPELDAAVAEAIRAYLARYRLA